MIVPAWIVIGKQVPGVRKRQQSLLLHAVVSLTAHWSMGSSSFALKLQTPETAHSEGTETEGTSGRQYFLS